MCVKALEKHFHWICTLSLLNEERYTLQNKVSKCLDDKCIQNKESKHLPKDILLLLLNRSDNGRTRIFWNSFKMNLFDRLAASSVYPEKEIHKSCQ